MKLMVALAVIFLILFLIAMIPLKARVQYAEGNLAVSCFVWLLKISIYPKKNKTEKRKKTKEKKPKSKKETEKTDKPKKEKGKTDIPALIKALIHPALDTLSRLKRKLLIDLEVHIVLGTEDPYDSAMSYGKLTAIIGAAAPLLDNAFRIGKRNITTGVDFESQKTEIEADVAVSLRIWHIVYIACGLLPAVKVFLKQPKKSKDRKVENYGQASGE